MRFKDHFSGHADRYQQFRPDYPPELLRFLASAAPDWETAWDCATGSGQAAAGLAAHFVRVIATDASFQQLSSAVGPSNVAYLQSLAEQTPLRDASVSLTTVAQALHWFDLDRFYAEVRRVLRPGGLIAVWTYSRVSGGAPDFDAVLDDFFFNKVGAFWPPERRHVDVGYSSLPFPFERLKTPSFEIRIQADIDWMLGYMRTWSACQRYLKARGRDPVTEREASLRRAWGRRKRRQLRWKMPLLLGRGGVVS